MNRDQLREMAESSFTVGPATGDKVVSLRDAVARHVRPRMMIHLAVTHYRPTALLFELCRQFWGRSPRFTLACIGFRENGAVPVYGRLVERLISPIYFDLYPTPAPNPIFQRAHREGTVRLESWSMLTLPLRLLAGAMNVPFLPTRSLSGSSMAAEHPEAFAEVQDPFGGGSIGVVGALRPDISFAHALMADRAGNAVMTPPYGETWGMLAAKEGVILSVERVVSTETIRQYSHLARLPAHRVLAVVEAPFGAHPGGMFAEMVDGFETYGEDYEFQEEYRRASRDLAQFDAWTRRWVLECKDHEAYLASLGTDRLASLRRRGRADAWRADLDAAVDTIDLQRQATSAEIMAAIAVRCINERVVAGRHQMILAGVGAAHVAAWVAAQDLHRSGTAVDLVLETGFVGHSPRPGDPFIFNFGNMHTAKGLTDILHVLGIYVAGNGARCLGVLGFGQMDRHGNLNTTLTADGNYLVGSGGANDVASGADECIAIGTMSRRRFVDVLPYVTSPGNRIRTVVSDLGVLERDDNGELVLTACVVGPSDSEVDAVQRCREQCGWDLRVATDLRHLAGPDDRELAMLRLVDPHGHFLGE